MDWLGPELLFTLFAADSGAIPTLYRVCKQWRDIAREYIRLYRQHILTINVTIGTDKTIYTTTSDGAMNGLYVAYGYIEAPNLPQHDKNCFITPIEISEMCMNRRHGRSIRFSDGECNNIIYYTHGSRIDSVTHKVFKSSYARQLITDLYQNIIDEGEDQALGLVTIKSNGMNYKYTPNGRLHHKIFGASSGFQFIPLGCKYNTLISYPDGTPMLTANMIGKSWLSEVNYYNQNGSSKMIFMQQYKGNGSREIYYDTGYRLCQRMMTHNVHDPLYVYDSTGECVFTFDAGIIINCKHKIKNRLYICDECAEGQMRREFAGMWHRISDIIATKSPTKQHPFNALLGSKFKRII